MNKFRFNPNAGIILCKTKLQNKKQNIFLKLAVDTGASITMISIESALAIGIDPFKATRHIEITTTNGVILTPIITIPSFTCFGIDVKNMDVICHNLPAESSVEGLLGLNFLKSAKVSIDFSRNEIISGVL